MPAPFLLSEVVATWQVVADTSGRKKKIEHLSALVRRAGPEWVETVVSFLIGETRQGKIGIGYAMVQHARGATPAAEATLTLPDVETTFDRIAHASGPGSKGARTQLLGDLMHRATGAEQAFLAHLLTGELRQGALEGIMADAVAKAASLPPTDVRRAAMLAGHLAPVARAALTDGASGLAQFRLQLFRPVQPMLAHTAEGAEDAITRLGTAALEHKLDGARVQVHRSGSDVRVFTRSLNDVTHAVPEVVAAALALPVRELILDGEAIALAADGRPHPFQVTMRRFGRKLDDPNLRVELPLSAFFFDALSLDGQDLLTEPASERFRALADAIPPPLSVPRLITASPEEADAFLDAAVQLGHEGIMAKALDAPYEAGSRGKNWLKVKPAHTLDLVVLAVEWGSGRRQGWLSNLHLGARDPATGGFVMLGKTFKGMTDEMLAWQTQHLQTLEVSRDAYTVYVRPELVAEIAFDSVQASPHYPGGLALRFARVKRYRPDKRAAEADTIDTIRALAPKMK